MSGGAGFPLVSLHVSLPRSSNPTGLRPPTGAVPRPPWISSRGQAVCSGEVLGVVTVVTVVPAVVQSDHVKAEENKHGRKTSRLMHQKPWPLGRRVFNHVQLPTKRCQGGCFGASGAVVPDMD